MIKSEKQLEGRKQFVKLAINQPSEAAKYLELAAQSLQNCNNTIEVLRILSDVLFLSTRTLENDAVKS